jgi:uncharacterized linocin/CFP29 family protein
LQVPFEMSLSDLDDIGHGAQDPNTDPVVAAARAIAIAEDNAVFHGFPAAGIHGICETEDGARLEIGDDYESFPELVATALDRLRDDDGVDDTPYAIALGAQCYKGVSDTTHGGYPVLDHVRHIFDGPFVWAPGLDGAAVLSNTRRGLPAIGYLGHDREIVRLCIEETFIFWILSAQAAIPLVHRAWAGAALPHREAAE